MPKKKPPRKWPLGRPSVKPAVANALKALFLEAKARGKVAILAGAGVSRPAPSNLPLAGQLTHGLLARILPGDMGKLLPELLTSERIDRANPKDFLRFETLCEMLVTRGLDEELEFLDCLARCRSVNSNHVLLAGLLQQGHPIMTTNFDDLIERACEKRGFRCAVLAYAADYARFGDIKVQYPLFKLHGSFVANAKPARDSLRACLNAIVKAGAAEFMEPEKAAVLARIATDNDLLVLGYSGADDFDILPALSNVHCPGKKILWVQHQPEPARVAIHSGEDLHRMPRDACGYHLASHVEFLATLIRQGQRTASDVVIAEVDTGDAMNVLESVHEIRPVTDPDDPYHVDVNGFLDEWIQRRMPDAFQRLSFTAAVLVERQRYDDAWSVLKECDRVARPRSHRDRLELRRLGATVLMKLERFAEANRLMVDAGEQDLLELSDEALTSRYLLQWSDLYYKMGRQLFAERNTDEANDKYEFAWGLVKQGLDLGLRADDMAMVASAFLQASRLTVASSVLGRFNSWYIRSFARSRRKWVQFGRGHLLVAFNSLRYRYALWGARRGCRDAMTYALQAGELSLYCASALELSRSLHEAGKYRAEIDVLNEVIDKLSSLGYNQLLVNFYSRLGFAYANTGDVARSHVAMALVTRLTRRTQTALEDAGEAESVLMEKKDFTEHREAALLLQEKLGAFIFDGDWGHAMSDADERLWEDLLGWSEDVSWKALVAESDAALMQRLRKRLT